MTLNLPRAIWPFRPIATALLALADEHRGVECIFRVPEPDPDRSSSVREKPKERPLIVTETPPERRN